MAKLDQLWNERERSCRLRLEQLGGLMKASELLALLLDVLKDESNEASLVRVWHIKAALERAQAAEAGK